MLKHTDSLTMDILMLAENALAGCENAYAVLNMWIDGIPSGDKHHEEACRVGAVMTLLNKSIRELTDAREYFEVHKADGGSENEK